MHLLVVPSTSVKYDEEKERRLRFEAKQKRLQTAEDAKQMGIVQPEDKEDGSASAGGDTFVQRLLATIIKNLEVNITKVHIRYI